VLAATALAIAAIAPQQTFHQPPTGVIVQQNRETVAELLRQRVIGGTLGTLCVLLGAPGGKLAVYPRQLGLRPGELGLRLGQLGRQLAQRQLHIVRRHRRHTLGHGVSCHGGILLVVWPLGMRAMPQQRGSGNAVAPSQRPQGLRLRQGCVNHLDISPLANTAYISHS
jgi:hypothetical protein